MTDGGGISGPCGGGGFGTAGRPGAPAPPFSPKIWFSFSTRSVAVACSIFTTQTRSRVPMGTSSLRMMRMSRRTFAATSAMMRAFVGA